MEKGIGKTFDITGCRYTKQPWLGHHLNYFLRFILWGTCASDLWARSTM